MALTQTRTERDSTETLDIVPQPALERVLSSSDHKTIGRLWISAGAVVALVALIVSAVAGFEHMDLDSIDIFEDKGQFTQAWSAGRTLLFFGGIVPVLVGLATYLTPLQVGASAIAFGRGAAGAFWTWLLGTGLLGLSYVVNGGPAGGSKDAVLLWVLALGTMVTAVCWALICIATTILGARTTGMKLEQVPVSTWSFLVFSLLGLVALPILIGNLGLAYADVTGDYLASKDARLALLSVMDGVSFAPGIYWVTIPVLGMALDVIATQTGRALQFRKLPLILIGSLAVLAFGADLMSFGIRRPIDFDNGLLVADLLVAVLPFLLLLGLAMDSVKHGRGTVNTPFLGASLGLILLFAGAAVTLIAQIEPLIGFLADLTNEEIIVNSSLQLNGSAFHDGVRGLILGSVFLVAVSAVHHWSHKIWGRTLDDKMGLITLLLTVVGTICWGGGTIATGLFEQPALPEVAVKAKDGVELLNAVSAIGFVSLAAAALLLALNIVRTGMGQGSAVEPWVGTSLEWSTTSPPPAGNFAAAPVIGGSTTAEEA